MQPWEIAKEGIAFAVVLGSFAVLLWWLLKPRVEDAVEAIVSRLTRVEEQVTPNGAATRKERQTTTADRLVHLERVTAANSRRIENLGAKIDEHIDEHRKDG